MALAGEANIRNARTTFETLVDSALNAERATGAWERFATRLDGADGVSIDIGVPGAMPGWRRWAGSKDYGSARVLNRKLEFGRHHKSIKLERKDVVHDKTGLVASMLERQLMDVSYLFTKLVFEKLAGNPTGADGVALFHNTHPFSGYDNLTTDALSWSAVKAAKAAMRAQTAENGEYLAIEPDTLLVHPDEEEIAMEIAGSSAKPVSVGTGGPVSINGSGVGAASIVNIYQGSLMVVVTPLLTSGDWVLADSRYKPIALGVWRDPETHIQDSMTADSRMDLDIFKYSVESDANVEGLEFEGVYGKIS